MPPLTSLEKRSVPLNEQVRAASSCQNAVVLPWSKDRIDDKAFPSLGPVYEEATKPLPGLAGESRSGDANGQWFRVMVAAPKFAYPFGTDKFFFTDNQLQGVNPPVPQGHKRSPLRPDVPCETQQPPDLRTIPDGAPNGFPLSTPSLDQLTKPLTGHGQVPADADQAAGPDLKVSDVPGQAPGAHEVRRAIRKHLRDFAAIVALAAIATGVGGTCSQTSGCGSRGRARRSRSRPSSPPRRRSRRARARPCACPACASATSRRSS